MAYRARLKLILKSMVGIRDPQAAEAVWMEGMWLNDNGDIEGARQAFEHAKLLDPGFAGAHYNFAAMTERLKGPCAETVRAWEEYLTAAASDRRQSADIIARVQAHVRELKSENN